MATKKERLMSQRIKAVFQNGAFVPQQSCDLPEGSEVDLIVESPRPLTAEEKDPEERRRILRQ